jgi:zinc transport system substrate-binding protein
MKLRFVAGALLLMIPTLAACGNASSTSSDDALVVSAALYPIAEIVQRVGGDSVEVVNLTPPGTDAHDVELTAKQMQKLEESDAVFFFGDNFQPGTQKAITALSGVTSVDLFDSVELLDAAIGEFKAEERHSEDEHADEDHADEKPVEDEHNHGEHDPHVWLDPANMIAMTKAVVSTLSTLQPESASAFADNGETYIAELTEVGELLDAEIGIPDGKTASRCDDVNLYTAHQGFTYLAHRAGLTLVPIGGINPDEQVSAQYLESLATDLKGKDVTIFYESLITSSATKALADSLNVTTDVLNGVEGLSNEDIANGITYISAQRDNIQRIAKALRCS